MGKILELGQWDGDVLKYSYTSFDMDYLEDKADRIQNVVSAMNKDSKKYDVYFEYESAEDELGLTLHVTIQQYEQHKHKENKNLQKGDI